VSLLLDKGADTTLKDNRGETPLDLALRVGHEDMARLLEQHRAGEFGGHDTAEFREACRRKNMGCNHARLR